MLFPPILALPLALFVLIPLLRTLAQRSARNRLAASSLRELDRMDGATFERYLEVAFAREGYRVERTPDSGDWGADLVLSRRGVRTVVQAKRYSKSVGVRAVQEVVAAKAKYRCRTAMVVTNSYFTAKAQELARVNGVILWDRDDLCENLVSS